MIQESRTLAERGSIPGQWKQIPEFRDARVMAGIQRGMMPRTKKYTLQDYQKSV
jgi:hypothetical protein